MTHGGAKVLMPYVRPGMMPRATRFGIGLPRALRAVTAGSCINLGLSISGQRRRRSVVKHLNIVQRQSSMSTPPKTGSDVCSAFSGHAGPGGFLELRLMFTPV